MAASDVRPLDNIILRVDVPGSLEPGVSYHRISEKTGELNPKMFKRWGSHLYRVQNISAGKPEAVGESTSITTKAKSGGQSVDLAITYRAFCARGQEELVVRRLGRYGNPSGELDKILTSTARELLWDQGDTLFSNLDAVKENIVTEVINVVESETGLSIQAEVAIKNEEKLESRSISQRIQIQFSDLRSKVFGVVLDIEFAIDPRKELVALSAIPKIETLEARALDTIEDYFKMNVPAHAFFEGFRNRSVQAEITQCLNNLLEPEGRYIAALELRQGDNTSLPKSEIKLALNAEHKTLRSKPIMLQSDLILRLDDFGQYMRSEAKDFQLDEDVERWANVKFQTIVDRECLEKRRIDFLNDSLWSLIKEAIKAEMENEVRQIGYRITQIVSEPLIPEREFCVPRNHRFEIEGIALRSTSDERVRVTVAANFYINQWQDPKLSKKIEQDLDLEEDLKREIHDALTTILIAVSPDWFFLRFNRPEVDDEGVSLQDMLVDAVGTCLKDGYKCVVNQVSVNGVDNEDVRSIQAMLWGVQKRSFDIVSNELQGQPIPYKVQWKVIGLSENQWHLIVNSVRNLEELNTHTEELLKGELALLSDAVLRFKDEEGRNYILDRMQSYVSPKIETSFGLKISFQNVLRDKSELENEIGKMKGEVLKDDINDNIAELEHQRILAHETREAKRDDLHNKRVELNKIRDQRRLLMSDPDNVKRASAREELSALKIREAEITNSFQNDENIRGKGNHLDRDRVRNEFFDKPKYPMLSTNTSESSNSNTEYSDTDITEELSENE